MRHPVEPRIGSTGPLSFSAKVTLNHEIDRLSVMPISDDEQHKHRSADDAELEREIRDGRKFTLEEAVARMAGPGAMKGESPITRMQQAEIEIGSWLRSHLMD